MLLTIVSFLVLYLVHKLVSSQINTRRYKAEAAGRGCLPAPTLHSNNFLGVSRLRDTIRATKANRGPQYMLTAMNEVGKDVHTLRVPILGYELLVTSDPENVKAMLLTESADYDHSRALVRPQFSKDEISNIDLIDRHFQALLRTSKTGDEKWTPRLDLQPLFFYFSLDAVTESLYGQSVESQAAILGIEKTLNRIDDAAFAHHLDKTKHFVNKHRTNGAQNPLSTEEKAASRKFVLLDALAKETQDTLELRNETLHTLVAGRDATGALLGWKFYLLARHPAIFDKMRSIIVNEFGVDNVSKNITFHKLRACEYIQWALNEVIRFVAIAPMNERTALRDTTSPRGGGPDGVSPIFVRKCIRILIPTYGMQHWADIWKERNRSATSVEGSPEGVI
ncbi:cytochrome P450 family protein [Halenospora varia]|nr:cytochrome P450 family protein [Halenospora varia]